MRGKPDRSFGGPAGTVEKQNPISGRLAGTLGPALPDHGKGFQRLQAACRGSWKFPEGSGSLSESMGKLAEDPVKFDWMPEKLAHGARRLIDY